MRSELKLSGIIYGVVETGYKSNSLGSFLIGQLNDKLTCKLLHTSTGRAFIEIKFSICPLLIK